MKEKFSYQHSPVVRRIFMAMLIPTILMNLTTAIGSMADTVIIGHYLDDLSLSVVTFATPIYMVINTLAALFAVGGCIAMSIDAGKGEKETANRAFSISMEFLVLTGVILLLAGLFFSKTVTTWLGAGEEVFEQVRLYARIILVGGPVFVLNVGVAFFVRNDGRPTLSMVGMFLSIFVDIILNVVFVGLMDMGVAGAAYSTVLGQLVSVLVIAGHFFTRKNTLKFRFAMDQSVLRIVKNGTGTALHFVYQFLTILIMNHFIVSLAGTDGVVVYTVVFNLYTVSLALFEGLSQTIQPMVSVYYGEKSHKKIKDCLRLSLIATVVLCGAVTLLLELAPQLAPTLFGISDGALLVQSAQAVRIYAIGMIMMTVNVIIGYYLQSIEQNAMAAWHVSLRCCIVFLICTVVLGKLFGMNGVWAAYAAAEVITFGIYLLMNQAKRRKLCKTGIKADWCLLNKAVAENTCALVCSWEKENMDAFEKAVQAQIEENASIRQAVLLDTGVYLESLKACAGKKKGGYVEVEINGFEHKVIVRDNLNHQALSKNLCDALQNGSEAEYGPVLGWNRICLM